MRQNRKIKHGKKLLIEAGEEAEVVQGAEEEVVDLGVEGGEVVVEVFRALMIDRQGNMEVLQAAYCGLHIGHKQLLGTMENIKCLLHHHESSKDLHWKYPH